MFLDDAQRHHGIDVYNITMRASTACESSIMKVFYLIRDDVVNKKLIL